MSMSWRLRAAGRVDQSEREEQKLYYFHTDQIGTPLEMTDADGSIVWQATYKAWVPSKRWR
ncbi:uncharacterized protein RhaS with RHS repeats [Pseudomonas frederiksbergensis]